MIYNWLIKHRKSAYGVAIGFLIFTILVYTFQSCWLVRHIYKYIDYWAIPLSAAFMLVLAYMAYIAIAENRRIREEDRKLDSKRRSLDEIIEWAEDINSASLTPDISLISKVVELMIMKKERDVDVNIYIELLKKEREENVLMRYANSLRKTISIETITSEGFKKELLGNVQEVINTLAKFMCIKQFKLSGVMPTKKAFPDIVIEEIEKKIAEGEKSIDELWCEYAKKLADSVRNLLIEANKIKARDIG